MNGVSNITDKILGDAREWARVHALENAEEIQTLREQFAREAVEVEAALLADAEAKARAVEERSRSQAEMDRRKELLGAKQKAVNAAFVRALESLSELSQEERAFLMVRLALKYQTQDAEFIFNKEDQETVGPAVVETVNALRTRQQVRRLFSGSFLEQIKKLSVGQSGKLRTALYPKVGGFSGGFVIKEGNIENNCTFEVLVSSVRDDLEGDVSSVLFQ